MTAKQRVALAALRDAQRERDGEAVAAGRIAAGCPEPWHGRPDLVTAALVLLERDGMVLAATGSPQRRRRPGRAVAPPARSLSAVELLLEAGGRGELRATARGDRDRLARRGVASLPGGALGDAELAEAGDRDVAAGVEL